MDECFDEISNVSTEIAGENTMEILKNIRLKYVKNIIVGHLNINTIENKIDSLKVLIPGNIDIMVISETKIDDSFPTSQFHMDGFRKPFRLDRNNFGGGLMIYVREDIPCNLLKKHSFPGDIEGIFLELNFRKSKWLLFGTYHPPSQNDSYYFDFIGKALDVYDKSYDNFLLVGDFNAEETEIVMSTFLNTYSLKNLVKEKTCFKSLQNPSTVDLFLTNNSRYFQGTRAISVGISDFHKLIITVMKTTFEKLPPRKLSYRSYRKFNEDDFRNDLLMALEGAETQINFTRFQELFLELLNKHAPLKEKTVRANEMPYMTKSLRKAIMTRSRLENKYHKDRTSDSYGKLKKQNNFCNRLRYRERKSYYENLDENKVKDGRDFWKTIKPFLSDKGTSRQGKITLIKDGAIISDDLDVANTMNIFFDQAVSSLFIKDPVEHMVFEGCNSSDPIDKIIYKYSQHPSIKLIKENVNITDKFLFKGTSMEEIQHEIKCLNPQKSNPANTVTSKNLQKYIDICSKPLYDIINRGIETGSFDDGMKLADLTPIHKKDVTTEETNYRNISGLAAGSKIFERIMHKQMGDFLEKILSPYMCGYRKGYSTQHALLILIEKWRAILDKKGYAGAILMDLSKAFDTLNHELLIAKLAAYGFDKSSLLLVKSYLSNRWQRTKINKSYSSWSELLTGVPQGSILGPLLFNIYLNDLFYLENDCDVCNFADDTTPYACDTNLESLMFRLEFATEQAIEWFEINYMKLNVDKCHLIIGGHKEASVTAKIGGYEILESKTEQLLGVKIDNELSFNEHVLELCKKAGKKLNALSRLCKVLSFKKRRSLVIAFFESQFKYCPLVWMNCSRTLNSKINALQYRSLKIVYRDYESSFEEILKLDKSYTVHNKNIQALAIEMYRSKQKLAPIFMNEVFEERKIDVNHVSSNTRSIFCFYNHANPRTTRYGLETLRHIGPQIWNMIPSQIKELDNLDSFKLKIKQWIPLKCPCRLCRTYIANLGFI